ncbi:MFS transporter [Arsenophonus sp. aPb]|uniref:MFS transporter n=1 Tax=Arsenophonus sp. aPb TaxID=3041619 RepID=UPI00246935E3|nr:MFS transporter [Arsenophonus sp. aPb]WGL97460.1 MFS transporter [Arsenophonus sp. aPb]
MLQIACLLLGKKFMHQQAIWLLIGGLLWALLGLVILCDELGQTRYIPVVWISIFTLIESLITLSVANSGIGSQKFILFLKGGLFFLVSVSLLIDDNYSHLILSIVLGFNYLLLAIFSIVSALVVRHRLWKRTIWLGGFYLLFAMVILFPYPLSYQSTFPIVLAVLLMHSGISAIRFSSKLRVIRHGQTIFTLMADSALSQKEFELQEIKIDEVMPLTEEQQTSINLSHTSPLTVHIWTPEGSADLPPRPRPVINRYIAAVDRNGVISTGHAALEIRNQIYISLYPIDDIDRSPSEFLNKLKATEENNVAGEFQPDYDSEVSQWCRSDFQIHFYHYNAVTLAIFWQKYRQIALYNLTYRNCSSSVAYALEAALEGVLADKSNNFLTLVKLLLSPELWVASQIRQRAISMAWTPGLVMDYSRALNALVHPTPHCWYQRFLRIFHSS